MPGGRIQKATAKRIPARASKKDPWDEKQLMTSPKSRLVDIDLVVRAELTDTTQFGHVTLL
jgi:hypothetical protein